MNWGQHISDISSKVINVGDALTLLLDNILYDLALSCIDKSQGIHLGTNCAPLAADLFLFCYEWDFTVSISDDKQANASDAFNNTSRYLDDILNINDIYFDNAETLL